jgi:hypothetical protein
MNRILEYSLVIISSNIDDTSLDILWKALWDANIPLLFVASFGFFGYSVTNYAEHISKIYCKMMMMMACLYISFTVIDKHQGNTNVDFRIKDPFPELLQFFQSFSYLDRSVHLPYPIYLHHMYTKWTWDVTFIQGD